MNEPCECDAAPDPALMSIWLACDTGRQADTVAAVEAFGEAYGQGGDDDAVDVD